MCTKIALNDGQITIETPTVRRKRERNERFAVSSENSMSKIRQFEQ